VFNQHSVCYLCCTRLETSYCLKHSLQSRYLKQIMLLLKSSPTTQNVFMKFYEWIFVPKSCMCSRYMHKYRTIYVSSKYAWVWNSAGIVQVKYNINCTVYTTRKQVRLRESQIVTKFWAKYVHFSYLMCVISNESLLFCLIFQNWSWRKTNISLWSTRL
jgi:hypothetical protein